MKVFQAKFVPLRKPTESQRQTIEQVKRWIEHKARKLCRELVIREIYLCDDIFPADCDCGGRAIVQVLVRNQGEDAYTDLLWFVIPYEELRWEYD